MSPEEQRDLWASMQRKIDFILEMQAQSEERQARAEERQAKADERQARAEARCERDVACLRRLARMGPAMLRKQDERIAATEKLTAQLAAGQEELRASLKAFLDSMNKGTNGHN